MTSSSSASQNPVAVITGAGSGIGRAIADRFLKEGWGVIAIGRRKNLLDDLTKLAPAKDRVLPLASDLTDADQLKALISSIEAHPKFAKNIQALINNAGSFEKSPLSKTSDELWRRMWEINFLAPARLTRELMRFIEPNHGVIINISSTLGLRPTLDTAAYSAAKAAMINWTQTLALEAAPHRMRANCICPGIVDTPIHALDTKSQEERAAYDRLQPLGRVGRPEDIAHAVWSLAAPGSEWITGATLKVDGGIDL